MENAVKTKVKGVWEEFSEVSGFGATTVLSRSLRKIVDFKIKCADEDYTDTDAVHELLEELKVDMTKYQHVDFIMDRTHTMAGFSLDMKARDYLGTTKDWARLPFREFVKHDSNIWAKTFLPAIKNFLRIYNVNVLKGPKDKVEVLWITDAPLIFWVKNRDWCVLLAPVLDQNTYSYILNQKEVESSVT